MPELDLDAIEARERKATPGPWGVGNGESIGLGIEQTSPASFSCDAILANVTIDEDRETDVWVARDPSRVSPVTVEVCPAEDDAEFIAHAREDVRLLVDEVKRLRARDAHIHDELRGRRSDDLNVRGILSPQPGTAPDPGIPFPLGPKVAPAVEWLVAEVRRLQGILDDQHEDWRGGPA